MSATACGICGSHQTETLLPGVDEILRCAACGVGYSTTAQAPAAEDLFDGQYYNRGYLERAEQWRYEAELRLRWLLSHAQPANLLEIGCAGGFFVERARAAGIDVVGVELSPSMSAYARETLCLPVHTARFEETDVRDGFDAVCAFHVLEHVEDPNVFVGAALDRLSIGGILALEVPNIDSSSARRDGSSWAALQADRHRWHFSPGSLTRMIERQGLTIIALDTVSSRFYMRRRQVLTRPGLALLGHDLLELGSPHLTHPNRGDYLRLAAQKP